MVIYDEPRLGDPFACPYLPGKSARFLTFYGAQVSERELDLLLERGWRRFGHLFFRPECNDCCECVPIRVIVRTFSPSASQRRAVRKNRDLSVSFTRPQIDDEAFCVYREHSRARFGADAGFEDFQGSFAENSSRCIQSSYRLNTMLVGLGFLDRSEKALSSIYFAWCPKQMRRGLGNYSVVREVEYAAEMGLDYYYLGYHITGNHHMAYKDRFYPHEKMDWRTGRWHPGDPTPRSS